MDKDFAASQDITYANELASPKAARNRIETIKMIDRYGGLFGEVLDIGEYNLFTSILMGRYKIFIHNTTGDLDISFNCPDKEYDFVHYNNVIEHQFSPLFTLLNIHKVLKNTGVLIVGAPIKPYWITPAKCHFHEMDNYRFYKLITRAGFKVIDQVRFWHDIRINGIRGIAGSFYAKQAVFLLTKS